MNQLPKDIQDLLYCLRYDGEGSLEVQPDWDAVVAASKRHLVTPLLHLGLEASQDVPAEVRKVLREIYLVNLRENVRHLHLAGVYLGKLQEAGIPVVVLKGGHLAECVYSDVGARVFSDADLMVKPVNVHPASSCLFNAGAFDQSSGLMIDLHWYLEDRLELDMNRIWSRVKPVTIGGTTALTLSPEDLLIHLCLHLGFHHDFKFCGLRTLCDIREIISGQGDGFDWSYLIDAVEKADVSRVVYLPLHLAARLLKVPVPEDVLTALRRGENIEAPEKWALFQMFQTDDVKTPAGLSPNFWQLWTADSIWEKITLFRKVLVPDRNFLIQKYPASHGRFKSLYYYLVRFRYNAGRYLWALARIAFRSPVMRQVKEKEITSIRMKAWLVKGGDDRRSDNC